MSDWNDDNDPRMRGIGPRGSRPRGPARPPARRSYYYNDRSQDDQYQDDRYEGEYDEYDPRDPDGPRHSHRGGRTNRAGKPRRPWWKTTLIAGGFSILILLVGGFAAFAIAYAMTPVPDANKLVTSNTSIVYYSDGKTVLGKYAAQNRISVNLQQVPKPVQDAVIAAENRNFWSDKGIDPVGIVRAAFNTAKGDSKQGASTITQQYVKNFYLSPERTWSRKMKELFITMKIQRTHSKQEILQDYLNTSFFGRGSWGIQTASDAYFGKDVKNLTAEEGAVLASLLRAPSNYDPEVNPNNKARLENRFRYTLRGMEDMGALPKGYAETAKLPVIKERKRTQTFAGPKGYMLDSVKRELSRLGYSDQDIETGGLRITTTFDLKAQRALEKAIRDESPTKNAAGVHVGAAAIRPGTGEVVAMYGGPDYLKQQYSDATQAEIQPGSTFKAFALAAALEKGISLKSRFFGNTPYWVGGRHTTEDRVANLDDDDWGKNVDLIKATAHSINTAFVDLTENKVGAKNVLDAAIRAGIPKDAPGMDRAVPKAVLGQASVHPIDLANAYGTFASGGYRADRHYIKKVEDSAGQLETEVTPKVERVFDSEVVADVDYALQAVTARGGSGDEALKLNRPVAGKTGTHEKETSWFAGYTPQLSAAVAFYKDENGDKIKDSLIGVGGLKRFNGGEFPARIWTAFMKEALKGQPVEKFPEPANIGSAVNPKPKPRPKPSNTPLPTPSRTPSPTPTTEPTKTPDPTPTETNTPDPEPSKTPNPKPTTPKPTRTPKP